MAAISGPGEPVIGRTSIHIWFQLNSLYFFAKSATYTVAWSSVSSLFLTSLPNISSEPFSCESLQGKEEHLHQTRFVQPLLLHVHGDTLEVA